MPGESKLGTGDDFPGVGIERQVIHDSNATHPVAIPCGTCLSQLLRLPFRDGNGGGVIGPHEPVSNKARLGPEDGDPVGVDLMEDPLPFGRVKVDVPVGNRHS